MFDFLIELCYPVLVNPHLKLDLGYLRVFSAFIVDVEVASRQSSCRHLYADLAARAVDIERIVRICFLLNETIAQGKTISEGVTLIKRDVPTNSLILAYLPSILMDSPMMGWLNLVSE